jgi:hypothetical protein
LFVGITNKYNRASIVFAAVLGVARALFQWFPAFWTVDHVQIPSWITRENNVKNIVNL